MINQTITKHFPHASKLAYGCMGLGGGWNDNPVSKEDIVQTQSIVDTLLENGVNYIDHADIYTFSKAEQVFGHVLAANPSLREQLIIQSKCGIRFKDEHGPKRYDFSANWITSSVEGILSRLQIEQLDVLQLHRPDPLMNIHEVAEALGTLQQQGKIKHVGVSNMNHFQIALLQSALDTPIVANQVEVSLKQLGWIEHGILAGNPNGDHGNFCAGTLEYCQLNNIQIQAWGALAQGLFSGRDITNESASTKATALLVKQLAEQYDTNEDAIVLAWLMRHPANIQPVLGSTNLERIKRAIAATTVQMSREHWYQLFETSRGSELP
ncbi:aldo/keto reductase family oxidoreductase [Thalassotalea euphylliae]|uniref:aldo/keto reductase n=1 Tax=Thalassotalea euphylliae TaxID=1655234 RepID=UPI0036403B21